MIRYPCDDASLAAMIIGADARWFEKAKARTASFIKLGRFDEKSSIWSKAKPAFMRVQQNKCAFCERQFESPEYGTIEFDLEHFRPKSAIQAWPDPVRRPELIYSYPTGPSSEQGYYWLAYETGNYAASCKICNTTFKLAYFPIASDRGSVDASIKDLANELPFLCYPIGVLDTDPEELITFQATTAVPAKASGLARQRGEVIIDFFGLNLRENLHRERARMIALFGTAVMAITNGTDDPTDHKLVAAMDSSSLPHAGCVRAFKRLWQDDPGLAARIYDKCRTYAVLDLAT